jgi:hypothetical protein
MENVDELFKLLVRNVTRKADDKSLTQHKAGFLMIGQSSRKKYLSVFYFL